MTQAGENASLQPGVPEVHARLPTYETLRATVNELRQAGYIYADASVPADKPTEPATTASDSQGMPADAGYNEQSRWISWCHAGGRAQACEWSDRLFAASAALLAGPGSGALMERVGHSLEQGDRRI